MAKKIRPTMEQISWGSAEGWTYEETAVGYAEMEFDGVGSPLMVCKIDCMEVFTDDIQAGKQAKKDGHRLLFLPHNQKWSPLCYGGLVATEDNLKNTFKYIKNNGWSFNGNADKLAEQFKKIVQKNYGWGLDW